MAHDDKTSRRWWQYKRTWIVGVPLMIVLGYGALSLWGISQPKPEGFAPTGRSEAVAATPVETTLAVSSQTVPVETTTTAMPDVEPSTTTTAAPPADQFRVTIDAKSEDDFVFFDFATGSVIDTEMSAIDWDLAFRTTTILTNSGDTNPEGRGGAYDLGEVTIEEATVPASVTFVTDAMTEPDDDDEEPALANAAIGKWYSYNFIKHVINVKDHAYLVHTGDEQDAIIQFDSYYCADEEPRCITFRYELVPAVDAS